MKTPKLSLNKKEQAALAEIKAKKKGKYIRIKCWTPSVHSSSETHAKSITEAVRLLKISSQFHSNWLLEFVSE